MPGITSLTSLAKSIADFHEAIWQSESPQEPLDEEVQEALVHLRTNPTILPPVQFPNRDPPAVYHRSTRTQDIYQVYHTYDLRRFHKIYFPNRQVIDKAIVRGRTNTLQGLHWMFRLAEAYFKSERLIIKIQRSRVRQWRCKKPISAEEIQKRIKLETEEEKECGYDFSADKRGRKDYILSTAGIRNEWQMFLEDRKKPRYDFDLPQWEDDFTTGDDHDDQDAMGCPVTAFREKWFTGDFDEALVVDGLDMVISTCDCLWNTGGMGRIIDLKDPLPCYKEFKLRCWGCRFVQEEPVD
ncbi:uncharacterized protein F5Z01DRAFT_693298 [Emericellopsis atlantica]|uniref:Uncharacterized protein n=1 Tax=Emericellopsis atlantica TaxID=2614577 RepID=A0A9P8CLG0_9HYPO|nr:uncharacterized protein F5Z01DRAFT_693298 [Emericellopsis atlantica]KAG9250980.1 hypothetical protein F5Z01DRAFT_693298 [Emericellopsis atlantica]